MIVFRVMDHTGDTRTEFNTDNADIIVDGELATENELRLGMVVLVTGVVDDNGQTGSATRVVYTNSVQGPLAGIEMRGDGDLLLLDILGEQIIVERRGTVFDEVSFDSLVPGELLEVSGFLTDEQALRATRVGRISDFVAGVSIVELPGDVANLEGTQFTLGDLRVDFSGADLSGLPGGEVSEGQSVLARGTLEDDLLTADRITQATDVRRDLIANEEASVAGAVSELSGANQFLVDGVTVDASNAVFDLADMTLRNGQIVQVDGTWDGNVLAARRVQARRGVVAMEAVATEINTSELSLTLQFQNGVLTVQTNDQTLIEDGTGAVDRAALSNFSSGDFLAVEAIDTGGALIATFINRKPPSGDLLQAPVESFTAGLSITLLGISFDTQGAQFQDAASDSPVSSTVFYEQLQVGDLVRVRDEQPADGVADTVVFGLDSTP